MMATRFKGVPVLVTGGCGFIGGHLVDALVDAGAKVTVFDRNNCLAARKAEDIKLITGKLSDEQAVRRAVTGKKYVFHLGANASVPYSFKNPVETHLTNVLGTLYAALACADLGARMVFSSSCSVYGDYPGANETNRTNPLSPYALQKLTGEGYVRLLSKEHGLRGISLRYFNVYGPRQAADSSYSGVIAKFAKALANGERPVIYGDGEQTRDFVYVDDVVEANLQAALSESNGSVFNIGSGHNHTIKRVLELMAESKGIKVKPIFKPAREGDVKHSRGDVAAARTALQWEPKTALQTGLERTLDYFWRIK
jgi:nucleoside-diphosphate-sugar epimerase